jgi:hypothetical protein
MLPDTGIDDVKKQRNAEYAKHINDPVLSSLKMEGISLLFFLIDFRKKSGIISQYSIKVSVFITETEIVYCAVRTGTLTARYPVRPSRVK